MRRQCLGAGEGRREDGRDVIEPKSAKEDCRREGTWICSLLIVLEGKQIKVLSLFTKDQSISHTIIWVIVK